MGRGWGSAHYNANRISNDGAGLANAHCYAGRIPNNVADLASAYGVTYSNDDTSE
jgi:hypothetical protein